MFKMTTNVAEANVITHAGTLHADDVLATVILERVLGDITVCRTFKVPDEGLSDDVIIYDIGFGKYDHHQKGGNGCRENGVPYASVGLIWRDFGRQLVANTCNPDLVCQLIDRDLIQGVDAADNGKLPKADYPAQAMTFYQTISLFNPNWDSKMTSDDAFVNAVNFSKIVFDNFFESVVSKAKAQGIAEEPISKAADHVQFVDDVLTTVILERVLGDITVCRTSKIPDERLSDDVIIYDIGFGKYDHHQKGGNSCRENGVPYASVGLIWRDFGRQLVANTCNPDLVCQLIDRDLIQGVDAADNGKLPKADYPAQAMTFYQTISLFNPNWDSKMTSDDAFVNAVNFSKIVFDNFFESVVSKAKAQGIVEESISKAEGHIIELCQFVPWQEFVFSSKNEKANDVQFVVFPSNRGGYNWQCVPDVLGGFGQRKSVPNEWRGLSGPKLQEVTGIATASFCHPAGFIGGAETLEDARKLAKLAVEA